MINAVLVLDKKAACLKSFKSTGHATYCRKGQDIVCSAFTLLVRTVVRVLSNNPLITVFADVERKGFLAFRLESVVDSETDWLRGVTDILVMGLKDLVLEYPEHIVTEILYEEE